MSKINLKRAAREHLGTEATEIKSQLDSFIAIEPSVDYFDADVYGRQIDLENVRKSIKSMTTGHSCYRKN